MALTKISHASVERWRVQVGTCTPTQNVPQLPYEPYFLFQANHIQSLGMTNSVIENTSTLILNAFIENDCLFKTKNASYLLKYATFVNVKL